MTGPSIEILDPEAEAFDNTLAEQLALSRDAFAKYSKAVESIELGLIGKYYGMPPKMQALYDRGEIAVYRAGLKSSNTAKALRHLLMPQGWKDCPRGVKCHGTELYDGDDGAFFLFADISVPRRMQDVKSRAAAKRTNDSVRSLDGFAKEAADMGVVIEQFDVRVGQVAAPDVGAELADNRRSQARGKRS